MSDWTKELSEEHPELYLSALEGRIAQAGEEVDTLLDILEEQGFKPKVILDLNCGIGRHSIELGKRGISVLGTDLSSYYIEIAKKRAEKLEASDKAIFRVADMREIASIISDKELFDGVVNLFTSFGFYDDKTNDDILRQCYQLVRPGGFFVLEIMNRDWIIRNLQKRGFSRRKDMIVLDERYFDQNTSRMHTTWTYLVQQGEQKFVLSKQITIDHRVWSPHELIEMFKRTGWQFKAAYPSFGQSQNDVRLDVLLLEGKHLLLVGKKLKK